MFSLFFANTDGLSAIDKYTDDTDTKSNNNNNNNNNNNTNSDFAVEVHALDWMTATNESLSCFAHVQTFLAADAVSRVTNPYPCLLQIV